MKEYFDKIYCIHTEGDTVRLEHIINEFKRVNITTNDFKLVSNKFPEDRDFKECLTDVWVDIINDAKQNDYKKIIIFEDDFRFINTDKFDDFIKDLETYGEDWDIFQLGGTLNQNRGEDDLDPHILPIRSRTYLTRYPKHFERITKRLVKINGGNSQTAHSVAVKNTVFDEILTFPTKDKRDEEKGGRIRGVIQSITYLIDNLLFLFLQDNDKYNTYLAFPSITEAVVNVSNLTKTVTDHGETKRPLYKALLEIEPLNKD